MSAWRRYVRPQDFVWLVLFTILAVFSPEPGPIVPTLLIALGVVQVLEPRVGTIAAIILELILCYILIGYSGGISSSYYLTLLLPVVSASTTFGISGTIFSTLAACGSYLSFLLFLTKEETIDPDAWREVALREMWFAVLGFLTYQLAQALREQTNKVAEANRSLQEAQAEVRRAERLAALGQLTAGLAHELRNPLGTMKTSAEMLSRQVGQENEIAREMAGYITAEVDRTNTLITRFLDFARPKKLQLLKGDVAELLDSVIARFEAERPKSAGEVAVYKNYSPDIPPVELDAQLLERALVNLLTNAAQASPAGSAVTVKTRMAETPSGPMVEIAVIDRGSGIEQKNLENIFNPFFTTKSDGVGLGLAVVSKIIDDHDGSIAVESAPGEGSVFRVFLPVRK